MTHGARNTLVARTAEAIIGVGAPAIFRPEPRDDLAYPGRQVFRLRVQLNATPVLDGRPYVGSRSVGSDVRRARSRIDRRKIYIEALVRKAGPDQGCVSALV